MHTWPIKTLKHIIQEEYPQISDLSIDSYALETFLKKEQISTEKILQWTGKYFNWPVRSIASSPNEQQICFTKKLPYEWHCLPIGLENNAIEIAFLNPFEHPDLQAVAFALGQPVQPVVADPLYIVHQLNKIYDFPPCFIKEKDENINFANEINSPICEWTNALLEKAIYEHASDIHLETTASSFKARIRINGELREVATPTANAAPYVINRLKNLASVDTTKKNLPQDGKLSYHYNGRRVAFRFSSLPTCEGESIVLRVLDTEKQYLKLNNLGMPPDLAVNLLADLKKPHGLIVIAGPTGGGKTTTLYALLDAIEKSEKKIITIEDPIEYDLSGTTQVNVHTGLPLVFDNILKAALRHDPDIIVIGEIRDKITAKIAIQASITGHLVLTTIHSSSPQSTIHRLMGLGIEPYWIACALNVIVHQELLPKSCSKCQNSSLDLDCFICKGRSIAGREPLFKYLAITPPLQESIINGLF